ncbi:MAG: RagB/SusD family nutrient uptake outer membrane protein [Bacteroidales bacterium]|nr:RagB/SusD family nutrient uptake outer membrane protein [Bacteroidales bacterium]
MKKIIYYTAVAGMLLTTACNDDLLNIEQKAASNTEQFYKSDADAQSARTAMYATFTDEIAANEGIWNAYITGINYSADDVFAAGGAPITEDHNDFRYVNEFRYDPSYAPIEKLYQHLYKAIYSANLIIDNFKGEKLDSDVKKQVVSEARVMRAWAHMVAAIVYYQPPKVDHLLSNEDTPVNVDSQKSLLDWCYDECVAAMADLPERKGADDKQGAWVVTKGFAQFVAGKSALFAGDYDKVVSVMKPLVESDKYALVPGDQFWNLFHKKGDGCSEKIFEFNYETNISLAGGSGAWLTGNGRGRWMVANVINWRGDDIVGGGKNPQICATGGWGGGSINHKFAHKMLEHDGDSYRRKATFLTSDEFFYDPKLCGWANDKEFGGTLVTREEKEFDPKRGINKEGGSFSRSDVMEVKMMMHPSDAGLDVGDNCNQTNVCIARLAEAYLIYAEACIQTGKAAEALTYINKIQVRAGVPDKNQATEATMEVLQDEKQYELWFEGCRWNDLVRWGIAKKCYDEVLDNIPNQFDEYWTSGGTKPHKLYYEEIHPFAEKGTKIEFIEGKHEYWPIPQSVIDVNPKMQQVRGWK